MSTKADLAKELAACTTGPESRVQRSQIVHRLNLLEYWFAKHVAGTDALRGCTVLEIGCGQGDMTVVLANAVSPLATSDEAAPSGVKVVAVDPAPLSYGTPYTLGQSQEVLSNSKLGASIEWVQKDPIDYLAESDKSFDYIVSVHSIYYLPSEQYLGQLLDACHKFASKESDKQTTLLLAEWGMRATQLTSKAHLYAVQAQKASPIPLGNVRTPLDPGEVQRLAQAAGWKLKDEQWMENPPLDDGSWEVAASRKMAKSKGDEINEEAKQFVQEMEDAIATNGESGCMDVWISSWSAK